jgi:predicted ATPase/DNA-binding CsgD family transcriptional regulator
MIGHIGFEPLARDSSRYARAILGGRTAATPALEVAVRQVGSPRSVVTRMSSPIFVGREDQLAELRRAWALAGAGSGQLRLVFGEAGIGKSRLVAKFLKEVGGTGAVLRGRCLDVGEEILPFGPIAEILRDLLPELLRAGDDGAIDFATLAPLASLSPLAQRADPSRGGVEEPRDEPLGQTRLFNAVGSALVAAARRRPRCVAIEDAHWLDAASRDLIRFLAHVLRDAPILVLLTVRDDDLRRAAETSRSLGELAREPHAGRIDLPRFDVEEVAQQLGGILGRPPQPRFVAAVHDRSGGNPFFTEEIVALDIATGSQVPPSLRDLLLSRLASLDAETRALIDAAAVGGRWVPDAALRLVADLPRTEFDRALRTAMAEHFLAHEDRPEASGLAFRHALVRDAVVDDLLPTTRRDLHAAWAAAFDAALPASAATAEHWDRAGDAERARAAYVRAADAAETVHAYGDVLRLRERALALLPAALRGSLGEAEELARVAGVAESSGDRGRAIEALDAALAIVRGDVTAEGRSIAIRLNRQLAELAIMSGARDRATAAMNLALELVRSGDNPADAGELLASHAMQLQLMGATEEARAAAEEALATATGADAARVVLRARHELAICDFLEDMTRGDEDLQALTREAVRAGHRDIALHLQIDSAWALVQAGRFEEADAANEAARELGRELGLEGMLFSALTQNGIDINHALGRWPAIEPLIESLERSARGFTARIHAASHRFAQGRVAEAVELARSGASILDHEGPPGYRGDWALATTIVARSESRWLDAVDAVEAVGPLPTEVSLEAELRLVAIECLVAASGGQHRGRVTAIADRARPHLDRLRELADEPGLGGSPVAAAHLATAIALAAELSGDKVGQPDRWAAAADAWERLPWVHRVAYCRYREAEARLLAGNARRTAEVALREAHAIAVELGARPLREEIEGLARRARIELEPEPEIAGAAAGQAPAPPTPADPHGLTEREREVLDLLVAGRTNREIGEALFISPKTAGVHVSNILGKLGAVNRVEAASITHRLRLLG